jgi:hypothetical protein
MMVGAVIAIVSFVVSLAVIGPSGRFAAGLAVGIVSGAVCVFLIEFCLVLAIERRKVVFSSVGFVLRAAIFAGVFYAALRFGGYEGGAGCAIAFLASYAGAAISPKLWPLFTRNKGENEPAGSAYIYEDYLRDAEGHRRYVFIKNHDTVKYLHGRRFVTHRAFHTLKEVGRDA